MSSILLASAVTLSHILPAQSVHTDSIIVVDASGQRVPFANISIKGGASQVTNESGILLLRAQDDTLNILARRLGFAAFQGKIGRTPGGGAFHIALARNVQSLNKVVVNETMSAEPLRRNGFYDRMLEVKHGAPTGEFFTPEDLEARPTPRITNFLYSSRYAKVMQSTSAARSGRPRAYIQGRAGCAMSVLVDGVVIHNMLGDMKDVDGSPQERARKSLGEDRTSIDDIVNGIDVMAMEVYPSTATAPMSIASKVLGSACGIVAIWTGAR